FTPDQQNRRTALVQVVEKVGPAVVNIFTEESLPAPRNPFRHFGNKFFDDFFSQMFPSLPSKRRSLGSGVLINPEGYILTNDHVIGKAGSIQVTLKDKRVFDAQLVGADVTSDLAVIKIDSEKPLPHVEMGRSDDLMIGETVIAIGNPFGLQHTVTAGIVSALNRSIRAGNDTVYHDFIQVDASINPGNSGGPLLNINGSLIGITTAIYDRAEGIGFAIPIDNAKRILDDLIHFGKVRRGWLGVSVQNLSPQIQQYFKLDRPWGVMVTRVVRKSPADRAGLRRGDIIVTLDDHEIRDRSEYKERLASYSVGNGIRLGILRDGKKKRLNVKVASITADSVDEFILNWLGLRVQEITGRQVRKYGLATRKGV
ncbi:MAG: PDZ domain-containing protein, partial [Nitrospinaceae bacterium]|nr:PDZ domain-containing protein [Nitrospinaceae bacterium]NIR57446.1 PDZ domain-containing protein [Nitrospinaceae bacterium]NIS87913.1 PDZ domain-containing protein [Nitrospinaceae bacterium]NIT84782.1 PDZ domain-containing protein [Nitrospinaceae bacterium]NIU46956.1 PDZ domain-containing protein [Nitrospinaceae bacterium]